jgi:hypothetical protein
MRLFLSVAVLAGAALTGPAAAQANCIVVPDGAGNAAVHCQDGRVGHLSGAPGGVVSGMVGGQMIVGPPDALSPPLLDAGDLAPRSLNPDRLFRATPLAPSPFDPPAPSAALPEPFVVPPIAGPAGRSLRPNEN